MLSTFVNGILRKDWPRKKLNSGCSSHASNFIASFYGNFGMRLCERTCSCMHFYVFRKTALQNIDTVAVSVVGKHNLHQREKLLRIEN